MNIEIKAATRRYHVGFEQDNSAKFKDGRPRTVTVCKIFLLTETSGHTLVGRGITTLGKKDKADIVVACRYALMRALDNAKLGKEANTTFWREFQLRHRRPAIGGTFDEYRKKLIDAGACQHKFVAKGSGADWCTKRIASCISCNEKFNNMGRATGGTPTYGPRSKAEKDRQLGELYGYRKRVTPPTIHTVINNMPVGIVEKALKENADVIRDIIHKRVEALDKRPSWLRRVGRAVAKWWNETERI